MNLSLKQRIDILIKLGQQVSEDSSERLEVLEQARMNNAWFTIDSMKSGITAISSRFLEGNILEDWVSNYQIVHTKTPKTVGMVLAGNIPLVGFHDILCTFVCGHHSLLKLSDKDTILMKYMLDSLESINLDAKSYFSFTNRLSNFDAVIATGSNNTATYFHKYFGNYPNIIRKNRNAVAVLDGNESKEDLHNLGIDLFTYFGLGCRNVSKIYVPKGYNFEPLLEELHKYNDVILHNKYKNNYDYNIALYLLNKAKFLNNGSIILMEDERIPSRIATCHYSYYENKEQLGNIVHSNKEQIQCIVGNSKGLPFKLFDFGQAQSPAIDDYADGVDTMEFLSTL